MTSTAHKPRRIPFAKMHGCGNDFVFIDNRDLSLDPEAMPQWAQKICRRAFGVYADGLIFLDTEKPRQSPDQADYYWHFFNADGSRAEMCGNASRCAAKLALEWGLAVPEHVLGTDAGAIRAKVYSPSGLGDAAPASSEVKVELTKPVGLELNRELDLNGVTHPVHFVNTGVPHAVVIVQDAAGIDIAEYGPALRYHEAFAPAGTNANIVEAVDNERLILRTYERGVEDETYACGTGAAAAAIIAQALGLAGPRVEVTTSGQEVLTIILENDAVFLQGMAVRVFDGQVNLDAVGL